MPLLFRALLLENILLRAMLRHAPCRVDITPMRHTYGYLPLEVNNTTIPPIAVADSDAAATQTLFFILILMPLRAAGYC